MPSSPRRDTERKARCVQASRFFFECWDCAHLWDAANAWLASRCPKCESKNVLEQVRDD